ncbi:DUF6898 family protein [Oharaeibacter diazotrophicus]|uniref:DUF6898 domain-containing protein n=2 Tax=Oharaeibacter diazotrophicus TaxID=1920512 RepID=A0A4R6RMT5_9HYPH|nr:hypothetical protein [Oharaeibacter diazotrophicus]TDP87106.1 hypothetical protein EDD54_0992 [Oharaeibacter diazotrophicus]BBE70951.1 hypothetical protein OHA_1_00520 [Pleomorphomonas sp. SM30]GLS77700.1 hypothetical protein GCM10007904_30370 [Oharaeibacter diazotrophicus]
MAGPRADEIYFEHTVIGRQVKVAAIDGATGTEVSIVGPASAAPRDLEALALRKLLVRLGRGDGGAGGPGGAAPGGARGGGILA